MLYGVVAAFDVYEKSRALDFCCLIRSCEQNHGGTWLKPKFTTDLNWRGCE